MPQPNEQLYGAGPWTFGVDGEIPRLEAGDSYRFNFRTLTYNGQQGFFRKFLPLSDLQVTNESDSNPVLVRINDGFGGRVPAGSVEPYANSEVSTVEVVNLGGSAIDEGELIIELSERGYSADEQARENKGKALIQRVLSDVVPGL